MAYERYVPEFTDKNGNVYGVMDAEAREEVSDLNSAINDKADQTEVGDLTELKTIAKTDMVSAVNELYDLIMGGGKILSYITCVFTQGQVVVYNTDTLDSLKRYLVVTATYLDTSTETISSNEYTLSGTLAVGTSTITASYKGKTDTFTVNVTRNTTTFDVCLFAGQSNMDGRGDASDAPVVAQDTAFKYDPSTGTVVDFVSEGSLIPEFVKTYYEGTGVPIVEVKRAVGGVDIATYISNYLSLATRDLGDCITYLQNNGKTVRRVFVLWNQGESDVEYGTTEADYETDFDTVRTAVFNAGATDFFIINIGQAYNNNTYDFTPIRTALQDVCNGSNTVIVSDKFYNAPMKGGLDTWHYNQDVYNVVGKDSAENVCRFFSGDALSVIPFNAADVYGVPEVYGLLTDWTYETKEIKVKLNSYTGTDPDVHVYRFYRLGDMYFEARIKRHPGGTDVSCFNGNTGIETIEIDSGVRLINNWVETDAQQDISYLFYNCSNLASVTWYEPPTALTNFYYTFYGCTSLDSIDLWSSINGNISYMFANTYPNSNTALTIVPDISDVSNASSAFARATALTSVGDISGTYTAATAAFSGCSNLETIGVIGSASLTNINQMFNGCAKLQGVVRFESDLISSCTNAFNGVTLANIEIQVPANSTTYTTITTAYPNANVTTFTPAA